MTTLHITRGLPASGKTTFARRWVAEDVQSRARVNRDDLRASLLDGHGVLGHSLEEVVSTAQRAQVQALLERGTSVIVDDTNLRLRFARAWAELAADVGADFEVHDLPTPVEVCIERDDARQAAGQRFVGRAVIEDMAKRFATWPTVAPTERPTAVVYEPDLTLPSAVLVDIDGTVALMQGRSPYDGSLLHTDIPNPAVVRLVCDLRRGGEQIVFCSGRDAEHRDVTMRWLLEHEVAAPGDPLLMRPAGDTRKDAIVKRELFDAHVRDSYAVRFVLDDRNQVVRMWRGLGLTCLQVADGAF